MKIGIIGGTGGMGRWFARFFQNEGCEVYVSGRNSGPDFSEIAKKCGVVLISVPIAVTVQVIERIGPLLPESALLMDLTSLKEEPVKAMLQFSSAEVVGLHPLFGPRVKSLAGHRIVICPARMKSTFPHIRGLFLKHQARLIEATPEHHDEMMAFVQGLNHLNSILLGLTLGRSGVDLEELKQFTTPIFKTKLDILKKIFSSNSRLYAEIITGNRHIGPVLSGYAESLAELRKIIDLGDGEKVQKRIDKTNLEF
ncbi:MAG TPA: prephenate dehydrogenase/arogenate dehydrogenase family protein [Thermodesulfobacteriota bacterium]|nr:prephenate dehydrogenase/arogenate dehydrogenase family protein [Thermodesulfobacteriota bacterium]